MAVKLTGAAPWYHYIPLKPDYSDLYDIMAFFVGPVDENGKVDTSLGHDVSDREEKRNPLLAYRFAGLLVAKGADKIQHLARKIGEAGQRYALDHWSWRNMQAYVRITTIAIHFVCQSSP